LDLRQEGPWRDAYTDPANQLTNVLRTTSVMTVAGGLTNSPTSLSINGKTASIYGDKTFAATNVALVNGTNIFTNILTISGSPYTNQLTKNLPTPANLSYDLNGNMTGDGLHGYEYDCANQLTRITQTNRFKSEFVYDGFGRRRIRREYAWTGQWIPTSETHYVYDGMLVIQERDGNNVTKVSYTRGLDLSGDDQSAGGIGGLLARTDASGSAFYHADGNGNITAMINSGGTVVAKYLYDSYGNILAKTGSLADLNLYRFSSKEAHIPSGLYYYGFRYYEPNLQRWLNRDPIKEGGGINLYVCFGNSPINYLDFLGLNGGSSTYHPRYDPNEEPSSPAGVFIDSFFKSLYSPIAGLAWMITGDADLRDTAYEASPLGQSADAGPFTKYGTRVCLGTATVAAGTALSVGSVEMFAFGNKSVIVEGLAGGGKMGSGGLLQLRVAGEPPIIRFDFHPITGGGPSLPHIDSPPLRLHHWPWEW